MDPEAINAIIAVSTGLTSALIGVGVAVFRYANKPRKAREQEFERATMQADIERKQVHRIEELEARLERAHAAQITDLQEEVAAALTRHRQLEAQVERQQVCIENLQAQLAVAQSDNARLHAEVAALREKLDRAMQQIAELTAQNAAYEARTTALQEHNAVLVQMVNELSTHLRQADPRPLA